jgi:hypothetical protein
MAGHQLQPLLLVLVAGEVLVALVHLALPEMVGLQPHPQLAGQAFIMLAVVAALLMLQQVRDWAAGLLPHQKRVAQATQERPEVLVVIILAAVVVGEQALLQVLAAQAAQASSSLNTTHLHNPYSHSKVLASG